MTESIITPCEYYEMSDWAKLPSEPLLSVLMLTYNHAPFIVKAIEGVLHQETNFPFELVIGEDCSTDGTREIVLEYQQKYPDIIRVVTSDKNVGMKKNSNRTSRACRGKYLAFCEGDDYWHNASKLQKQVDHLESHMECGMVYSSYDVYHVESKTLIKDFIKYRNLEMPKNLDLYTILENKNGISRGLLTCTIIVRRDLCEQIIESDPYIHQSDHFLMGDTQIWVEVAPRAELHFIPESLATHTITEESATRSRDVTKVLRFSMSNAELFLYLCKKYNLPQKIMAKYEEIWCHSALKFALYTRHVELTDEVRKRKKTLTWKELVQYYGAKNSLVHYFYRTGAFFFRPFRKKHAEWR